MAASWAARPTGSKSVAGIVAHWSLRGIYWVDAALYIALALAVAGGAASAASSRSRALSSSG